MASILNLDTVLVRISGDAQFEPSFFLLRTRSHDQASSIGAVQPGRNAYFLFGAHTVATCLAECWTVQRPRTEVGTFAHCVCRNAGVISG